jgi:guanylate kinase
MKTRSQKPEARSQNKNSAPLLILISAPSGGGKTTLCNQLLALRPGEKDGMDYYFFSVAEFERRRRAGEFIEHATVYGNSYGILKSELLGKLRLGRDVLLNVDVQGAATIRKWAEGEPDLKRAMATVFLTPTSLTELADRLKKRAADSAAVIQKRLAVARREIAQWKHFDYLLVSASVPEDLRRMLAIVEAEKMRVARTEAPEF